VTERRAAVKPVVGVFGIGLAAYWPQFDGLKERLEGYQREVEGRLEGMGARIVSAGLVDTAPSAQAAGDLFARENVDLIACYVGTYATSSQVLPAVQRRKAPVLVLNLQPAPALDYPNTDTGEWLAHCSACCVPEISNAFARSRIQFNVVTGLLGPADGHAGLYFDRAWSEIAEWVAEAAIPRELSGARIGFLGHTYPGMLDMYSDFTMHHGQLGAHVEVLEMDDLHERVEAVTEADVDAKIEEIRRVFEIAEPGRDKISRPVTPEALRWTARVAAGLDRMVADFDLSGLAYYYRGLRGNANEELGASVIVGNSLLTAAGVPASGEGDLKNCMAMLIMDRLGAGGSYTEFYAMDFNEDFILMGHDGPGHVAIADGKPVLRGLGLYHGKRGYGISVEFNVKTGPITILAVTQTAEGKLKLLAAEGESLPGPRLEIGNTNSRLKFGPDPAEFMNRWSEEGPTHHCALGVGHQVGKIRKLARLLGLELVVIG
jgi:L-arabinose isomerase